MSDASGNGKKGRGLVNYGEFAPYFSGWMPICLRGFSRVHHSSRLGREQDDLDPARGWLGRGSILEPRDLSAEADGGDLA
jgi:hypothetical protein